MKKLHYRKSKHSIATYTAVILILTVGWGIAAPIYFTSSVAAKSATLLEVTGLAATARGPRVEYLVPNAPLNIAVESPYRIWFTAPDADAIGAILVPLHLNDRFTTYSISYYRLGAGREPYDLVYDKDTVWFTQRRGNKLGRIDVKTGSLKEYVLPTADSAPTGIDVALDGHIWVVEQDGMKLAEFDPDSETFVNEFPIPANLFSIPDPRARALAVQGAETVWFTVPNADTVVGFQISTGRFYILPVTKGGQPSHVALDSTGTPWITASMANVIGRYVLGTLSLWNWYAIPTANSQTAGITFQENDSIWNLWFAQSHTDKVGRMMIRSNGSFIGMAEYPLAPGSRPWGIALDSDGTLWVAENGRNTVTQLRSPYANFMYLPVTKKSQ